MLLGYDALEAIGHACGHNLIATSGLAAVLGIAEAMKQGGLGGRVVAMGTPAEEGGGGKIKMIRAGAYDDAFCCLMVHPMLVDSAYLQPDRSKNNAYSTSMCGSELTIEYIGKPAHAMVAPWEGINALDAVTLLHTSIGLLRQQILPSDRIRGVVLEAGQRSGVIPSYAKARYCVRSASLERYKILKQRFVNCLEAAALASGCELRTTWMPAYWDIRTNNALAGRYVTHMERLGVQFPSPAEQRAQGDCYSTDMGNVTYVVPSIHPTFAVDSPGGAIHTAHFAAAAATDDAHERTLKQGKAMAATGLEVLLDDVFAAQVKKEFDDTDRSIAQDPSVA
ncbi:amidohydrolase [Purpureocillium lilacinum]|uniref:Amidohydrolase n=1 Tax=Purpureocillium lilacinum TaxID=33203 RepID=A0A179FQ39_PURLI|nr:amidohydrolase [Purpureocillium lilacinum]